MYGHYNKVLRGQDDKQYVTTIHAIVSAIIKLASIMKLPANRKVYRGLSGIELPPEFWQEDEYGAKGGVEFGIMSTTRHADVAVQYSSYGEVPTIFEIEIGQVDRGAELNWISVGSYPSSPAIRVCASLVTLCAYSNSQVKRKS